MLPDLDLDLPIPVTLDGVLHLGRSWLAWRVHPSPDLLAMQHAVWRLMDDPILVAARSYDTETRTVSAIVVRRSPAPER
jgi:hypothetical protein